MKNKFAAAVVAIVMTTVSSVSYAQFGGLGGAIAGALGGGGGNAKTGVTAESIVKNYVDSTGSVMQADAQFLKALGLKEQAEKAELAAKNLTSGATASGLSDASKIQSESSKQIAAAMESQQGALSAEGKKQFAKGLVHLATGIHGYVSMSSDIQGFTPDFSSVGSSATAAVFVVKSLPSTVINMKTTLKRAIDFAKANKIAIPADATSLL
jgi:hypothetical protein